MSPTKVFSQLLIRAVALRPTDLGRNARQCRHFVYQRYMGATSGTARKARQGLRLQYAGLNKPVLAARKGLVESTRQANRTHGIKVLVRVFCLRGTLKLESSAVLARRHKPAFRSERFLI